ncbi:uncharacterized protein [Palaemon carinicauda]|uniref:uncharacterized protein n=1 Tax=Palaemon carinicauda TaxID=392227 RepID=UPI0035B5CACA
MSKMKFFQLPRTIKMCNRSLSVLLTFVIMSSACYAEANGNVSDNTTKEATHQSQGLFHSTEYQLRCDHLLTLRMEHYHLLLASLRLAQAMEDSSHSDHVPLLTEELNEFQLVRYSYRASWELVQEDVENVKSSNLSSGIFFENQCQAGVLDVIGANVPNFQANVRNFQEQRKERNCTDSLVEKREMLDVERQLESMMMSLDDVCSTGGGLSNLQNIYDQAQFLELKSKEMRLAIEKEYNGVSVNCDVLNGELHVSKVEDVSNLPSGESGIRITVDGPDPCSRHVFVSVTPVSTPSGPCLYINETQKVSTSEQSTIKPSFAPTSSLITNSTEELSTYVSSTLASQVSEILTTVESPITTPEKPTGTQSKCSQTLKEMIENLHFEMPQINEEFANVSSKAAECLTEATTFEEIGEIIYLLEIFTIKTKNMLHILSGNVENRGLQSTPMRNERYADLDGFTKIPVSLRASLENLYGSIEKLRRAFDRKETKHHVITAARDMANIFKQNLKSVICVSIMFSSLVLAWICLQNHFSQANVIPRKTRAALQNRRNQLNYDQIVPAGYRQEIAPLELDGSPLIVNFSIKVNGIIESNRRHTSVVLDTYFRVTWYDQRLNYPADEGNKVTESMILHPVILEKIWLPDPYIFNVRSIGGLAMLKTVQGVLIYRDKKIFISSVLKIELDCSGLYERYPFDKQECPLDVYSFMYSLDEMEMGWQENGLIVDPAVKSKLTNFDFDFVSLNSTRCDCYKCIPPVAPCVRANLILSRKALGHLLATFLPSGLFVAVSWASLFWPADVIPGRTVLVITSLLTLVSMHTAVRQSSPETSYIKAVDIWMFMCIVLSVLILFEYGLVLIFRKYRPFQSSLSPVQPIVLKNTENRRVTTPAKQVNYEEWIERGTRILIPVLFLLFNLVYWPYYLSVSSQ